MWESLLSAFCLMLVIEGIMPFLYPRRWRQLVATLANVDDNSLRLIGLVTMLIGLGFLVWLRS